MKTSRCLASQPVSEKTDEVILATRDSQRALVQDDSEPVPHLDTIICYSSHNVIPTEPSCPGWLTDQTWRICCYCRSSPCRTWLPPPRRWAPWGPWPHVPAPPGRGTSDMISELTCHRSVLVNQPGNRNFHWRATWRPRSWCSFHSLCWCWPWCSSRGSSCTGGSRDRR